VVSVPSPGDRLRANLLDLRRIRKSHRCGSNNSDHRAVVVDATLIAV
jgi:hypothetical protein